MSEDLKAENERLRKFLQNIVTAHDLEQYDGALFGCRFMADNARAALRGDPYPGEESPKSSLYHIARDLMEGAEFKMAVRMADGSIVSSGEITHYSVVAPGGKHSVILRDGECDCPCHSRKSIITHDAPCCMPFVRPTR